MCGLNAECRVLNHAPNCICIPGYTGNPLQSCFEPATEPSITENPCQPSPCGLYSQCREINSHAVCSCLEGYIGAPPSCKPECVVNSECPQNKACINKKCADPCIKSCGLNTRCQVVNHNPICTCAPGLTGDPFESCTEAVTQPPLRDSDNPCIPSPCGPNSQCRQIGNQAACSCLQSYIGRPPNCRPECVSNEECPSHLSCKQEKCTDPCPGSCGQNAFCKVIQHNPVCFCADDYEGDPFIACNPSQPVIESQPPVSPCEPSPCGPNAECREHHGAGACYCHEGFEGNPYDTRAGCRRECDNNNDCQLVQACVRFKCINPCTSLCGLNAVCSVENHIPICTCPPGLSGDPLSQCRDIRKLYYISLQLKIFLIFRLFIATERPIGNPCMPSPCGPNSVCRNINEQAVCSCQSGFIDTPPNCRPECVVSSECSNEKACINNKCVDPCPHTCGIGAHCTTKNHSPICACPRGFTGDPFIQCNRVCK